MTGRKSNKKPTADFPLTFKPDPLVFTIFTGRIFSFMAVKIEKWVASQKKHKLSDKHVQMARELGLNPDKLGKIDNHMQETWKAPLPQFIEEIYFKRFKRKEPLSVKPLKEIIAHDKAKVEKKKKEKEQNRKQVMQPGGNETSNQE